MSEPRAVYAGSTVSWQRACPAYPPGEGYALVYTFFGREGAWNVSGEQVTGSGGTFEATIAADAWAEIPPGEYRWVARAEKGGAKYVVAEGSLVVHPDPETLGEAGYDGRSHARKVLEALQARIEGRAGERHLSMSIAGKSIQLMSLAELIDAKRRYEADVRSEENAARLQAGLPGRTIIRTRFT